MPALLCSEVGTRSDAELVERAAHAWTPAQSNVVADVSTQSARVVDEDSKLHVVLIDCGVKEHIVESLVERGARVTVVPFLTPASEILALEPDGVLTSPGPGDPENVEVTTAVVGDLVRREVPFFGVCLGHQLLAHSIGASTSKLKFGHRGGNHPVKNLIDGRVRITSQNHGYQVDARSIPLDQGWIISEVNLNDGSVEGLEHERLPAFSVQYHPEGSPGPMDSEILFDRFLAMVRDGKERRLKAGVAV
jgi:carbamoyl-phosphate synthase small subunit